MTRFCPPLFPRAGPCELRTSKALSPIPFPPFSSSVLSQPAPKRPTCETSPGEGAVGFGFRLTRCFHVSAVVLPLPANQKRRTVFLKKEPPQGDGGASLTQKGGIFFQPLHLPPPRAAKADTQESAPLPFFLLTESKRTAVPLSTRNGCFFSSFIAGRGVGRFALAKSLGFCSQALGFCRSPRAHPAAGSPFMLPRCFFRVFTCRAALARSCSSWLRSQSTVSWTVSRRSRGRYLNSAVALSWLKRSLLDSV